MASAPSHRELVHLCQRRCNPLRSRNRAHALERLSAGAIGVAQPLSFYVDLHNTGEIGNSLMAPGSDFICYAVRHPGRLTMPTLILAGAHDRAVGVGPQRALASRLPHAQLVVFDGSAHFPYQEQPAAFQQAVDAFMATR